MFKLNKNLVLIIIAAAGILITTGVIFLVQESGQTSGNKNNISTLSKEEVAKKVIDYLNNNLLKGQATASILDTSEENGLVKMKLKIENDEFDGYATFDAKLFFPQAFNLDETLAAQQPGGESPEPNSEVTLSPDELTKFISCLKKADFVIYGANWCGWTKKLVTMLGGSDMVKPIYVECTENEKLCQEKKIEGFPTILIKGKDYQGSRTFTGFAETTGCEIPLGAESIPQNNTGGGCPQ